MPTSPCWTYRVVLISSIVGILVPSPSGGEEYLHARAGLPNCPYKLKPGNWINTIFLGSSTTAGEGASNPGLSYQAELMRATCAPRSPERAGAIPSLPGARALGGRPSAPPVGRPCMANTCPPRSCSLRWPRTTGTPRRTKCVPRWRVLFARSGRSSPITDLVFLYGLRKDHLEAYKEGRLPPVIRWHEKVAEHYGIPSVNMGQFVAQKMLAGELTFEAFSKDGIHPTDRGHALYAEAVKPIIAQCKAAFKPEQKPPHRVLPPTLTPAPMVKAQCVPYENGHAQGQLACRPTKSRCPLPPCSG